MKRSEKASLKILVPRQELKEVKKQSYAENWGGGEPCRQGTKNIAKALRQEQAWFVRGDQCGSRATGVCGGGEEVGDEMGLQSVGP